MGLLIGEDYFQSLTMLLAVEAAPQSFTAIELGSGWGYWAVKAAVAWHRRHLLAGPCRIFLVESDATELDRAPAHLVRNNVLDFCNATLHKVVATAGLLDE